MTLAAKDLRHLPLAWRDRRCAHLTAAEVRHAVMWLQLDAAAIDGPPQGMVVGETTSGSTSLFPWPPKSVGGQLLAMSSLQPGEFLGRLHRRGLLEHQAISSAAFSLADGRAAARALHAEVLREYEWRARWQNPAVPLRVLLVGARVAAAFGALRPWQRETVDGVRYVAIPHPKHDAEALKDRSVRDGVTNALRWAAGYL